MSREDERQRNQGSKMLVKKLNMIQKMIVDKNLELES